MSTRSKVYYGRNGFLHEVPSATIRMAVCPDTGNDKGLRRPKWGGAVLHYFTST